MSSVFGDNEATPTALVQPFGQLFNGHVDDGLKQLKFAQDSVAGCAEEVEAGLLSRQ